MNRCLWIAAWVSLAPVAPLHAQNSYEIRSPDAMTNDSPREVTIPLEFLGNGSYRTQIWEDGALPQAIQQRAARSTRSDSITLKLAPSGGAVVRFEKAR